MVAFFLFVIAAHSAEIPSNRVASIYLSEDFVNQQLKERNKSALVKDLHVNFDADKDQIYMQGRIQVPTEEMKAVNLDPSLGAFNFQVTIRPQVSRHGHLILEFPLNETFFYPSNSKHRERDRVVIPVQMLSLALASVRGYLAALSGDYTSFDRRTAKLQALKKDVDKMIALEKNPDAVDELRTERASLTLQLESVPIERKQVQVVSRSVAKLLAFSGEKEIKLNDELGARRNALILKIKLSQIVPYLSDVQLGGVRVMHDKKDGNGEDYLVVDVNADLETKTAKGAGSRSPREALKIPPDLIIRLNQALLSSRAVVESEKAKMGSKMSDFELDMRDDGLHVSGRYHKFFFSVPFDTVVDFITTGTDVFEVRVRELEVAGLNLSFLTQFVLEAVQSRLETALKGLCTFSYVGQEGDHSRAMRVNVNAAALVPAFPDLHLVNVDVREREFLMKVGRIK